MEKRRYAGRMTMAKGGVRVSLDAAETERLRALQDERDEAFRRFDAGWEALFRDACERAGIVRETETPESEASP